MDFLQTWLSEKRRGDALLSSFTHLLGRLDRSATGPAKPHSVVQHIASQVIQPADGFKLLLPSACFSNIGLLLGRVNIEGCNGLAALSHLLDQAQPNAIAPRTCLLTTSSLRVSLYTCQLYHALMPASALSRLALLAGPILYWRQARA